MTNYDSSFERSLDETDTALDDDGSFFQETPQKRPRALYEEDHIHDLEDDMRDREHQEHDGHNMLTPQSQQHEDREAHKEGSDSSPLAGLYVKEVETGQILKRRRTGDEIIASTDVPGAVDRLESPERHSVMVIIQALLQKADS